MHYNKTSRKIKYLEQLIWSTALILLFCMDPAKTGNSFCVAKLMGLPNCFGCGIGHSIHYALHVDLIAACREHIMGVPVTLIIIWQIVKPFINNKILNHGSAIINDVKGPSA